MSFANEIKKELLEQNIKKNCCKKAFLYGLLINAVRYETHEFEADYLSEEAAKKTAELLHTFFSVDAEIQTVTKPGKKYQRVCFYSPLLSKSFESLENDPESSVIDIAGFRCAACEQAFLRGVFIATAKLNDPQKSYLLDFSFNAENVPRASKIYRYLSLSGFVAKITNRANGTSLYFKSNTLISDVLYFAGAVKASFEYDNAVIEKEIRNNENRATNCVTRNIYKSVSASQKQVAAIRKLIKAHKFETLPEELKITATIRINNEEATLSELAALHDPPISKSGLNHRLEKICLEAEEIET